MDALQDLLSVRLFPISGKSQDQHGHRPLHACGFRLWSYLKSEVFVTGRKNIIELKINFWTRLLKITGLYDIWNNGKDPTWLNAGLLFYFTHLSGIVFYKLKCYSFVKCLVTYIIHKCLIITPSLYFEKFLVFLGHSV